jgi:hypothetical protein
MKCFRYKIIPTRHMLKFRQINRNDARPLITEANLQLITQRAGGVEHAKQMVPIRPAAQHLQPEIELGWGD